MSYDSDPEVINTNIVTQNQETLTSKSGFESMIWFALILSSFYSSWHIFKLEQEITGKAWQTMLLERKQVFFRFIPVA